MKQLLVHEAPALVITLVSASLLILGSGDWRLGFIPFFFLAWWLYLRLLRLEKWVESGMKASRAPHDDGLVGEVIRVLLRRQKMQGSRKKRLNQMLRRIHSQIAALPDATLILGEQLEIEWSNAPAEQLLGIRYPSDRGQPLGNLLRDQKLIRYIRNPKERKPIEAVSPLEPDIQLRYRAIPFGSGQRLLIVRNISEQKQVENTLKQFIAHASHELKTPLTTLYGYLEMLEDEPGLGDQGKQALRIASGQVLRMETLIRELLQLSRLGSLTLDPDQGDLVDPCRLTRMLITSLLKPDLAARVKLDCEKGLRMRGLPMEIESIVQNLLDNALKYTEGKVRVRWNETDEGELRFEVEDEGPGIPASELESIRQHYYRGKETTVRGIEGSGLGLAIVEQAARLHGGRLDIESDPSTGSRFSVTFPVWRSLGRSDKPADIVRI